MDGSNHTSTSGIKQAQAVNDVPLSEQLMWTLKEAAQMCGVSEGHYRKLRDASILPGPIPGTNRISADALRQALSAQPSSITDPNSAYDAWRATRD